MVPRDDVVWRWLHELQCPTDIDTPPVSSHGTTSPLVRDRKRKMNRSESPAKRQRTENRDEEILPDQSASVAAISELSERTRLSHPSQSTSTRTKRAVSPVRDLLNDLRVSRPAIVCDIPFTTALPEQVAPLHDVINQPLHERVIPAQLRDRVLTTFPLVAQSIPDSAYDFSETSPDRELDNIWEDVVEILDEARDCSRQQQDENQWCSNVIHPILRLASKGSMLKVQNVQAQIINPDLLPLTPRNYRIRKKADYAFSFHNSASQTSELYRMLSLAEVGDKLSQTTDATTKRLVLFSGLEVKHENGGKDEALAQLAIWLGAGMQHLRNLQQRTKPCSFSDLPPMIGWNVIGHDWHTYIAFGGTLHNSDQINILGPWRAAAADTRDVYGLFKLLKLLKRTVEYACTSHWPWLRENILQQLCSDGPSQ